MKRTCCIDGCERPYYARDWCGLHYGRWFKNGTPLPERPSLVDRFWAKVDRRDPPGCWQWMGGRKGDGYGSFTFRALGISTSAHRASFLIVNGYPPEPPLQLDHLCRNRLCVNPAHLEPVTPKVNTQRGLRGGKTECPYGHPYTPENTYWKRSGTGRECRACWTRRNAAGRARADEERKAS